MYMYKICARWYVQATVHIKVFYDSGLSKGNFHAPLSVIMRQVIGADDNSIKICAQQDT